MANPVFNEEFTNGPSYTWSAHAEPISNPPQTLTYGDDIHSSESDVVRYENGMVILSAINDESDNSKPKFKFGQITAYADQNAFGLYEVRVKLPIAENVGSAAWMWNAKHYEFDIFEFGYLKRYQSEFKVKRKKEKRILYRIFIRLITYHIMVMLTRSHNYLFLLDEE